MYTRSAISAEIRASYARKVKQYNGRPAPPGAGGAPPRHYRRPPLSPAPDLSPFFRLSSFPLDTHLSSLFRLLSFLPRSVERERRGGGRERVATMRNLLSWTMRATLSLSLSLLFPRPRCYAVPRHRSCRLALVSRLSILVADPRYINGSSIRYAFCNLTLPSLLPAFLLFYG